MERMGIPAQQGGQLHLAPEAHVAGPTGIAPGQLHAGLQPPLVGNGSTPNQPWPGIPSYASPPPQGQYPGNFYSAISISPPGLPPSYMHEPSHEPHRPLPGRMHEGVISVPSVGWAPAQLQQSPPGQQGGMAVGWGPVSNDPSPPEHLQPPQPIHPYGGVQQVQQFGVVPAPLGAPALPGQLSVIGGAVSERAMQRAQQDAYRAALDAQMQAKQQHKQAERMAAQQEAAMMREQQVVAVRAAAAAHSQLAAMHQQQPSYGTAIPQSFPTPVMPATDTSTAVGGFNIGQPQGLATVPIGPQAGLPVPQPLPKFRMGDQAYLAPGELERKAQQRAELQAALERQVRQ
jgi:hypothetical protein